MTTCTECEKEIAEDFPSGGLSFFPRTFGYYGGYWDSEPWAELTEDERVTLCRHCTEVLLRAIPSILRVVEKSWDSRAE